MLKATAVILLFTALHFGGYAQQTYQLNTKKSKIFWDAQKVRGGHHGYILFNSGKLNYSPDGEPKDGIFSLNMNSMYSTDHANAEENYKVDKELKTEGFFNMAKYPEATMKINQIVRVGQSTTFKVTGNLTMKGITNAIVFMANMEKKGDLITATAKTAIDRGRWHIDFRTNAQSWDFLAAMKGKMIADEIAVTLNLVFTK